MNKKILTIIIIISVLSLVGGVGVLLLNKNSSTTDGSPTSNGGGLTFRDFFPIGGSKTPTDENPTQPGEDQVPVDETPATPEEIPKLRKISFEPVTGYGSLTLERDVVVPESENTTTPTVPPKKEQVTSVRYQDKATGHIYQTYLDLLNPEKISNTTIPKVHHSFFTNKSEGVLDQYLTITRSIETFFGLLTKDTGGNYTSVSGTFLPKDILNLSVSPDGTKIFYLSMLENGVVGTIATPKGDTKNQVFASKFSEWLSQYVNGKFVTVTTKASARSLGYMYGIDTTVKSFDKILGGITGLTTLTSPDGKKIIYSATNSGSFSTNIYNRDTKGAISLGLTTLPEKCIWGDDSKTAYCAVPQNITNAEYPDAWYQGIVSFSDSFWKLDTETNIFELIYDTSKKGEVFDGINLQLSTDGKYLMFMNKIDNTLWGITL